ncbi:hypothetical protein C8Q79DRAFT_444074 [Trametes meyenii]|nr:hypothetical protein C8Q79DRAFT_444074 [Trametes meyenii]
MALADDIVGALLIEVCLACILYGATTLQTFIYYQSTFSDSRFTKVVVATIWTLESLHTVLCMEMVYQYTITHFGDFDFLGHIYWGAGASILISVLVSAAVHGHYIRRVWIATNGSISLTILLSVLALCRFACGIGASPTFLFILSLSTEEWTLFRVNISPLATVTLGLGCAAGVDVIVALVLGYSFCREAGKQARGPQTYSSRVDPILIYAVNTGAITAIFSILSVVLFVTRKQSLIFLGLVEIQSKLYANSFLGSLNIRGDHTDKPSNAQFATYEFTPRGTSSAARLPRFRTHGTSLDIITSPQVSTHQQTVVMRDNGEIDAYSESSFKGEIV